MKSRFLAVSVFIGIFLLFDCGLFYKGVPKKGEFCYVLVKPPTCLFVDFEKQKLFFENKEYALKLRTRMEYTFSYNGRESELLVSTENRVDLKIPGESIPKFYMRKKEKFSQFPESKP